MAVVAVAAAGDLRRVAARLVRRPEGWVVRAAAAAGAVLIAWSGALHLQLWWQGYNAIPTIGPLFLSQAITAFALALVLVAWCRPVVLLAALALMLGTIAGFILAVTIGVFGFVDTFQAPNALSALIVEVAASLVIAVGGAVALTRESPRKDA
ncbi:MAG: hypothetical protein M0014_01585 [Actinomycetota bacterium]|nr:hypothetical protein [Actinomycetota bacterium]